MNTYIESLAEAIDDGDLSWGQRQDAALAVFEAIITDLWHKPDDYGFDYLIAAAGEAGTAILERLKAAK